MKNEKSFYRTYYPVVWAVIIFLTGFFAMWLFWLTRSQTESPGFLYYKAGFWGDMLGLPLIVLAAGGYCKISKNNSASVENQNKAKTIFVKWIPCIAAALGAIVGIIWQISWLLGAPQNWTILELEQPKTIMGLKITMRFNAAGWWHAFFFAFAFAVISFFVLRFLATHAYANAEGKNNYRAIFLVGLLSFASCLYISFISTDNVKSLSPIALMPLVCLGVVGFLFITVSIPSLINARKVVLKELIAILSGAILAIAFASFILYGLEGTSTIFAYCCSVVVTLGYVWLVYKEDSADKDGVDILRTICHVILSAITTSALAFICISQPLSYMTAIWGIVLIGWPFLVTAMFREKVISYYNWRDSENPKKIIAGLNNITIASTFLVLCLVAVTVVGPSSTGQKQVQSFTDLVEFVVATIINYKEYFIAAIGILVAIKYFEPVKNLDDVINVTAKDRKMKVVQYLKILLIPFCCFMILIEESFNKTKKICNGMWRTVAFLVACIILGTVVIAVSHWALKKWVIKKNNILLPIITTILSYILILVCVAFVADFHLSKLSEYFDTIKEAFKNGSNIYRCVIIGLVSVLPLQITMASYLVRLTVYSNTYSIRGYQGEEEQRIKTKTTVISSTVLACTIITLALICFSLLKSHPTGVDIPKMIEYVIVTVILFILPPTIAHFTIREELPQFSLRIINGTPWIEVVKDGVLAFFIFLLACGFPWFLFKHLDENITNPQLNVIFYLLFGLPTIYEALTFCCKNNVEHFKKLAGRKVDDLADSESEKETISNMRAKMMPALQKHLSGQCLCAYLACFPFSLLFFSIGVVISKIYSRNDSFKQTWTKKWRRVIPDKSVLNESASATQQADTEQ